MTGSARDLGAILLASGEVSFHVHLELARAHLVGAAARSCLARVNSRPLTAAKRGLMRGHTTRVSIAAVALSIASTPALAQTDPGPRGGASNAGDRIAPLTVKEAKFFSAGLDAFAEIASVTGSVTGTEPGLGPRFNLTSCGGCHAHPALGGSSPPANPQMTAASADQVALVTSLGHHRRERPNPRGPLHRRRWRA